MNRSGFIRKLDKVGRVMIPADLRVALNLRENDYIEFSVSGSKLLLEKYATHCMLCGGTEEVYSLYYRDRPFTVCHECATSITGLLDNKQASRIKKEGDDLDESIR